MNKFEDIYMRIWCVVMPVMGTVLIPSVQGTIPAYMMAFGSVLFVVLRLRFGTIPPALAGYLKALAGVVLLWLFLMAASQLWLMISGRTDFRGIYLVDIEAPEIVLRSALFTQSLYFAACVLIGLYFRYFFREEWMRYVLWGGYFLAAYGIYEWTFFLIFHRPGDFLVNRVYGAPMHSASWSQGITFGGFYLVRIKSTLGEPTFFAAVCLPYLFLALDYRRWVLIAMLAFCALFSTSTACYIGMMLCLMIKTVWSGRVDVRYLSLLGVVLVFLAMMALLFPESFDGLFTQKLNGANDSGRERMENIQHLQALLASFDLGNWLFGIGFGYAYLSIFFGVLVNTGLIGFCLWSYLTFKPALVLPVQRGSEGLKTAMVALILLSILSLTEFFIPTTWMFLGLAHRRLALLKQESTRSVVSLTSFPSIQPADARI